MCSPVTTAAQLDNARNYATMQKWHTQTLISRCGAVWIEEADPGLDAPIRASSSSNCSWFCVQQTNHAPQRAHAQNNPLVKSFVLCSCPRVLCRLLCACYVWIPRPSPWPVRITLIDRGHYRQALNSPRCAGHCRAYGT